MKRKQHNHGVITVLISLILVGVLSIGTLSIEAGRYQAAKTQLAESNISTATSMIAGYDVDLYARYGLLAIDTESFTPERAIDYLNFNADQAAGYRGNRLTRAYVVESVELNGLYNLTYPSVLKRQILSRAKYHVVPRDYALNVSTMDAFFADFQSKCQQVAQRIGIAANIYIPNGTPADVPSDMYAALQALSNTYSSVQRADGECNIVLSDTTKGFLPSSTGSVEGNAPSEDLTAINSALSSAVSILGAAGSDLSYNNGSVETETDIVVTVPDMPQMLKDVETILFENGNPEDVKQVAKNIKDIAVAMSASIDVLKANKESNVLLNSYIAEYFSNRCNTLENSDAPERDSGSAGVLENANFISACVEYVFGGDADEQKNQESAYSYLQAIRLINNLHAVMFSGDLAGMFETRCDVSAMIAWAYYESVIDMELMTKFHVSVPFNKNALVLNINAPANVASAFSGRNTTTALKALGFYDEDKDAFVVGGEYAFSYKDSLAFGLWFVPNSEKMMRVADLIQLEMRYRQQHVENKAATFMMSDQNTYCRIKAIGKFSAVLPMLSLDSADSVRGMEFQSIKFAGY